MSETRNRFLHDFNTAFGVPDFRRKTVARALVSWWQAEGGATKGLPSSGHETDWNPWNTTLVVQGHSHPQPGNPVPVQVYDSRSVGLAASVQTLKESRYSGIQAAIMGRGIHASTICFQIAASDWGTPLHPMIDVLADITQRGMYSNYADITVFPS